MVSRIYTLPKYIKRKFLNYYTTPNKDAIWIFGFQKSGTSAIAALFAKMAGKTVTIDSIYLWEPYKTRMFQTGIKKHVQTYSYDFSRDVIKEPGATFFIETIDSYFTLDKYIFITRNPFDNIRSILNRLNLPGDRKSINITDVHERWRHKFKNHGQEYIRDLSELWLEANSQVEYMESKRCCLVKYEDFVEDKIGFTEKLISKFDLVKKHDISNLVDKQFQPKGDTNTNLQLFYGDRNLEVIRSVCGSRMKQLGYEEQNILE